MVEASHVDKIRVKSMPGRETSLSAGKELGKLCMSHNRGPIPQDQSKLEREHVKKVPGCKQQLRIQGLVGQENVFVLNTMFKLRVHFLFYFLLAESIKQII